MSDATATRRSERDALLVNAWTVTDGDQDEFVEKLDGLFEQLRTRDGFVEGAVLRSTNPTRFISYVRWRSAQDRQRLFDDELLTRFLDDVGEIARADLHSYDVLRSFGPDG